MAKMRSEVTEPRRHWIILCKENAERCDVGGLFRGLLSYVYPLPSHIVQKAALMFEEYIKIHFPGGATPLSLVRGDRVKSYDEKFYGNITIKQ